MNKMFNLLTLLTLPLAAHAETTRWQHSRDGAESAWIMHSQEGRIYLDHLAIAPGQLQELVERKSYDTRSLAEREFNRLTAGYAGKSPTPQSGEVTELTGDQIWVTKNEWSTEWENKYSAWVRDSVDSHFMEHYNIATDCAEVAVSLRWIFSRINGLPAANHLMGTGELFGNESMRAQWASLPIGAEWSTDRRFRAALDYVMTHIFTHTIMTDFYPVKIDDVSVAPGTSMLHLYSEDSGHTENFHWVGNGRPSAIEMFASTVPRAVRELPDYGIQDWGHPPTAGLEGIFRFRWPVSVNGKRQLQAAERMPWYSLDQYDPHFSDGFNTFTDAVIKRVVPHFTFNAQAALRAQTADITQKLLARVKIVQDGFNVCSQNRCVEGTSDWEAWSTPSRDASAARMISAAQGIYDDDRCNYRCRQELDSHRSDAILQLGGAYTLGNAWQVWTDTQFSSDPNDSINARWGL
jgi:hypothetical protein